jgi:hypothetical protein
MRVCTAVTVSHLPWARLLAASFVERHPEAPAPAVLVVDGDAAELRADGEPFRLLRPADIGIDRDELHRRAAMYRPMELAGSTRGALVATLLAESGGEPVLFLDADIFVLGCLEPLAEQARAAGVVLSPHLPRPPAEPVALERAMLRAGAHNAGYFAVAGERGARFAAWWAAHLARDCIDEPAAGLFVSQRWLDLAPSLFDVAMLRDPGSNVTHHNLGGRALRRTPDGWTIDGAPLRFLHVGGSFDPRAASWPHLSDAPEATALLREYSTRLIAAGHRAEPVPAYGYAATADGIALEPWVRRRCRAALLEGEPFPDPFDPATASAFTAWLAEPVATGAPAVSRWALALRDWRADLRPIFPAVPGEDTEPYLRWLAVQEDHAVPEPFRPPAVTLAAERERAAAAAEFDAVATERDEARWEVSVLRDDIAGLEVQLSRAHARADEAQVALDALRGSRVLRASRLPRQAWYRLRPWA